MLSTRYIQQQEEKEEKQDTNCINGTILDYFKFCLYEYSSSGLY